MSAASKPILFLCVVIGLFSSSERAGLSVTDADDVRTLKQIEVDWAKHTGNDPASIRFADQHIADSSTTVGMAGAIHHFARSEFLNGMKMMPPTLKTTLQISDVNVYLYGDTAIVTLHEQYTHSGEKVGAFNLANQPVTVTDTFIKRNGRWQAVAGVMTSRAPLPKAFYQAMRRQARAGGPSSTSSNEP